VKARAVALRPALAALLAAEAAALAALVALPPHRAGWWPATAISAAALVVLIVTVYRRNAPGWFAAWARHRRRTGAIVSRWPRLWTCRTGPSCAGCASTSTRRSR
jgi:hypothetical protein